MSGTLEVKLDRQLEEFGVEIKREDVEEPISPIQCQHENHNWMSNLVLVEVSVMHP